MGILSDGVSFVVGAAIGASYTRTMRAAAGGLDRLACRKEEAERRLGAVGDAIRYRDTLAELRAGQAALGRSSDRLDRGVREVERRYRAAKRELRGYRTSIEGEAYVGDRAA